MRIPYSGKLRSLRFWRKGPEIDPSVQDPSILSTIETQLSKVPKSTQRSINRVSHDPELPYEGQWSPHRGELIVGQPKAFSLDNIVGHELMHADQQRRSWHPFPTDSYITPEEDFTRYFMQPVEREARAAGWIADRDPQLPFERTALAQALGSSPDWEHGPANFSRQLFGAESPELVLPPEMLPKTEVQTLLPFEGMHRSAAAPLEDEEWLEAVRQDQGLRRR